MTTNTSPQQAELLTIEQNFLQAVALHQAGQLPEAEKLYQAILQINPKHPEANHNLGVLAVQAEQPAEGLPYFMIALDADPTNGQYWLSYIDALFQAGQLDAAGQVLDIAQQQGLQGDEVDALAVRLESSIQVAEQSNAEYRHDFRESLPVSSAVSHQENIPCSKEIETLVALFNEERYTEAVILAQTMTICFPLYGFGWKVLGAAFKLMGRTEDALEPMQKAAALSPGDADTHSNLGYTLQELGRLDEAEASCRRALQINPDYAEAHNNLSMILQELGRLDEAEAGCRRALQIRPDYAEAHNNLSITLRSQGRLSEAEAGCRRALQINPEYAEAHNNLATILHELGRLDEAEAGYRRALQIRPDYAEAHNNLGNTLLKLDRLNEAEANCRRALEIEPDYAEAHYNLGNILRDLARLNEAEASYRRALEIDPNFVEAYYDLGHILCDLDDFGQAAVAYQKTLDIDPANIGADAAVYLAILCYLAGNLELCLSNLLASQPIMAKASFKHKSARNYRHYLDRLLSWHRQSNQKDSQIQNMDILHVIGESHSLAAHGVAVRYNEQEIRCASEWIAGCKQWHLGNGKANKYKQKFETVMARLHRNSQILLFFGEIDCRHDEGIIESLKKYPDKTLAGVVQSTVEAYLDYVAAIGSRYGHKVIVGGVPCTNIPLDTLTVTSAAQLVYLIRIFNTTLKESALAAGMDFLDVYALTDSGGGIADSEWYLDEHHLQPNALVEAFDRCCLHHNEASEVRSFNT